MKDYEQRFMAMTDAFDFSDVDVQPWMTSMNQWLAGLVQALHGDQFSGDGLSPHGALARQAVHINARVEDGERYWKQQWSELGHARSLTQIFDNKVILLVFGKFNAGKSSLCNFLAERFCLHGRSVQYFHLADGRIEEVAEDFQEGATETTTRLQGVCLGGRLVLLDTPGLHSVTDENAALAQRFLESADAVLWLTSSTSPGQVQELGELAQEMRRAKPLVPIVTRSDVIEEDEVDGELVRVLRNKSDANRSVQENDVQARAEEKLRSMNVDPSLLKVPVSVSVHVARTQGQTENALTEAGFERLYDALLQLVGPALAYKQRKPGEILLHYLEEKVLGYLCTTIMPELTGLRRVLSVEKEALESRRTRIVQSAWRDVVPELPQVLESHAPRRDVKAVCIEVARIVAAAFERHAGENLPAYKIFPVPALPIGLPAGTDYEPALAAINGEEDALSIGYEKIYAALNNAVRERLEDASAETVMACEETLAQLDAGAQRKQDIISSWQHRLHVVRESLHKHSNECAQAGAKCLDLSPASEAAQ
jgi:predicted GTPase